jgi:hypothetical protein
MVGDHRLNCLQKPAVSFVAFGAVRMIELWHAICILRLLTASTESSVFHRLVPAEPAVRVVAREKNAQLLLHLSTSAWSACRSQRQPQHLGHGGRRSLLEARAHVCFIFVVFRVEFLTTNDSSHHGREQPMAECNSNLVELLPQVGPGEDPEFTFAASFPFKPSRSVTNSAGPALNTSIVMFLPRGNSIVYSALAPASSSVSLRYGNQTKSSVSRYISAGSRENAEPGIVSGVFTVETPN